MPAARHALTEEPPETRAADRSGARHRWWKPALLLVGICLAAVSLHGRLPSLSSTWTALRQASLSWLLVAGVLQAVSMGAFAEQQRHLLAAFGVRISSVASLAVSYARSAMATALPAGSAVSAGYAFRQYRARGANQASAAAVMLLSGVASVAGLALIYAGDLLAWASNYRPLLAIAGAVTVTAAWVARRVRTSRQPGASAATTVRPAGTTGASRLRRARDWLDHTVTLARTVTARQWLTVVALATLNWLTDLACLLTAVHAVGLTVPARAIATAYLVAQLIRQIPVTPGGIGIIEASLLLALTTAGGAQAPAAAAILLYRLLSCWSIIPIGLVCWTAAQRSPTAQVPTYAQELV